jgi:hypothetical protein
VPLGLGNSFERVFDDAHGSHGVVDGGWVSARAGEGRLGQGSNGVTFWLCILVV